MLSTAAKIRIASAVYAVLSPLRRLFGAGDQVKVTRRGLNWRLDLREGIDLTIYLRGAFEPDTLRCLEGLVRPGDTVIDVGANIGAHTLHLARLVGSGGRVLAFEPTAFAFRKLRLNLDANADIQARVLARQAFLADEPGRPAPESIASSWPVDGRVADDARMGSIDETLDGAEVTTLDAALEAAGNPAVSVVKIDVDGHELSVLRGARRLLGQGPALVMELAPYAFRSPTDFDAMVSLLYEHGYQLFPLGSRSPLPRDIVQLRRCIPASGSINVRAQRMNPGRE